MVGKCYSSVGFFSNTKDEADYLTATRSVHVSVSL
jgi:hypothetical protein